jgi:hypothetical protein
MLSAAIWWITAAPALRLVSIISPHPGWRDWHRYKPAIKFACKALDEVPYLALLLRTNFLEGTGRLPLCRAPPPTRIWFSSRRLPMMHRHGWQDRRASSNTCHAWFVWDASAAREPPDWFDWQALRAVAP